MITDSHRILARCRNHFSHLFSVDRVSEVRQTEIHTAEPLVLEQSAFEVEMAFEKLKGHRSPGIDHIPAKLINNCSEIHKLINSIWNKEELPEEWKDSIIIRMVMKHCSNYGGISFLPTTYKILSNVRLSRLTPYTEEINGCHQCGF